MDLKNGQFPFPFEKLFGSNPFMDMSFLQNPGIQEYVKDVLNSALPQQQQRQQTPLAIGGVTPEVFETHRSVIVRAKVPLGADPSQIRVRHNQHLLRIEGLTEERILKVNLPAIVYTGHTRSKIKDGILEVRLLKRNRQGKEREVFIEY